MLFFLQINQKDAIISFLIQGTFILVILLKCIQLSFFEQPLNNKLKGKGVNLYSASRVQHL